METYHLIESKSLGATNTKPARIKLISHRFGDSVILNQSYSCYTYDQVVAWFEARGVAVVCEVEMYAKKDAWGTSMGYLIKEFKPLAEIKATTKKGV